MVSIDRNRTGEVKNEALCHKIMKYTFILSSVKINARP